MAEWFSIMDDAVRLMDPNSKEPDRLRMLALFDSEIAWSAVMLIVPPDVPVLLSI